MSLSQFNRDLIEKVRLLPNHQANNVSEIKKQIDLLSRAILEIDKHSVQLHNTIEALVKQVNKLRTR